MVIHKVESREHKGRQHWNMVYHCISHWYRLNKADYTYYPDAMNMKTSIRNDEHNCSVAVTYHQEPNKW